MLCYVSHPQTRVPRGQPELCHWAVRCQQPSPGPSRRSPVSSQFISASLCSQGCRSETRKGRGDAGEPCTRRPELLHPAGSGTPVLHHPSARGGPGPELGTRCRQACGICDRRGLRAACPALGHHASCPELTRGHVTCLLSMYCGGEEQPRPSHNHKGRQTALGRP